jgi:exosortase
MSTSLTSAPARRPALPAWAQLILLAIPTGIAYHRAAGSLWDTWMTNDNYSHGPLVALTSLALVWLRRDVLRDRPVAPDARGLALVALACAMHIFGVRADLFALQGWSFIVLLFGLTLALLGMPLSRALAFPIGYLGFMLTFPPIVMNTASYALKEIATVASTTLAQLCGVELHRQGMSIFIHGGELRVENACSGLRSLLALLATGTLFAYFQKGGPWRRAAVLLAALPIAVLGNVARLTLLFIAANARGVVWATGRFHDVTGYVMYAVALGALLALRELLTPREERR